jgi:DNA-binding NarL/FixJ family response regulator
MTSPSRPRRIGLIDDHTLILDGLEKTLASMSSTFEVISATSPTHILDQINAGETFDLILCDLIMDGMNGLAFLGALQSRRDPTPVLLMSGIAMDPPIAQMKSLGAKGFLHKSANPATFEGIINTIIAGGDHFPDEDEILTEVAEQPYDQGELEAINNLTGRQLEVLRALANGASNQEISDRLSISPNTVKTHIKHIYEAMGVSRRTACVQKAQLYGIL